jgi:glutamate racemase
LKIPVLGVILAGARAAAGRAEGQRLGVIGTHATIKSGAYQKAIHELAPKATLLAAACPLFVPLAEEGWNHHSVAEAVAKEYLLPLRKQGIDTLVLGCTHYPLLKRVIAKVMGRRVALVDSASETAREVSELLLSTGLKSPRKKLPFSAHEFFVSDLPGQFSALGRRFLGRPLSKVTQAAPKEIW